MSVYSQVSSYSDYVDLQHYTGSAGSTGAGPEMSGAFWLSGSIATDTTFFFNSKMETPGLTLESGVSVTAILDQDNLSGDSATALATQQSIKAYVDSQVGATELSGTTDSGAIAVDLDTQLLSVVGTTNEIETSGSGQTITISLPSSVTVTTNLTASGGTCTLGNTTATALSSSTTLKSNGNLTVGPSQYGLTTAGAAKIASMSANWTNASRTVADMGIVTTMDLNGGTIDGTTIGASSQTSGKFTTVSGSGNASFRGTLTAVEAASSFAGVTCTTVSGSGNAIFHGTLTTVGAADLASLDVGGISSLAGATTIGDNGAGVDFTAHGAAANEKLLWDASENNLSIVNGSSVTLLTIGGDATSDFAIDVTDGANNANKIRAAAFVTYSDETLKTNVAEMQGALKAVNSLKAVNFTWKKDGTRDFGFLAQDLKKVIPQAVHGNDGGLLGVDYGRLTSVLVKAIQEQSVQIKALQE